MSKSKIIDAVYRKHKINLDNPQFNVLIVNEMIGDALDEAEKRIGELEKSLAQLINYGTPDSVGRWNYEAALEKANQLLTK